MLVDPHFSVAPTMLVAIYYSGKMMLDHLNNKGGHHGQVQTDHKAQEGHRPGSQVQVPSDQVGQDQGNVRRRYVPGRYRPDAGHSVPARPERPGHTPQAVVTCPN